MHAVMRNRHPGDETFPGDRFVVPMPRAGTGIDWLSLRYESLRVSKRESRGAHPLLSLTHYSYKTTFMVMMACSHGRRYAQNSTYLVPIDSR